MPSSESATTQLVCSCSALYSTYRLAGDLEQRAVYATIACCGTQTSSTVQSQLTVRSGCGCSQQASTAGALSRTGEGLRVGGSERSSFSMASPRPCLSTCTARDCVPACQLPPRSCIVLHEQ